MTLNEVQDFEVGNATMRAESRKRYDIGCRKRVHGPFQYGIGRPVYLTSSCAQRTILQRQRFNPPVVCTVQYTCSDLIQHDPGRSDDF